MPSHRSPGFSLIELLISVAILGLISGGGYVSLMRARQQDELYTATRVLMNDLGSVQAMALSSTNVRICDLTAGGSDICQVTTSGCVGGTCAAKPPAVVGARLSWSTGSYITYAKADSAANDLRYVAAREAIETSNLANAGAPDVQIFDFTTVPAGARVSPMNVAFLRQSGGMRINQCPTCTPATELTITLRHRVSGSTSTVRLNAVTGRISSSL